MKVKEALVKLSQLDPEAELMVMSLGAGGAVRVTALTEVDARWVDVEFEEYRIYDEKG